MMAKAVNPGSLPVRLGYVLQLREQAIFAGDMETASNMQDIVLDYCSVHMKPKELAQHDAMPGFAYGDGRSKWEISRDLSRRLRFILNCVKDHNIFARAEIEEGDAGSLDDLIEAEA